MQAATEMAWYPDLKSTKFWVLVICFLLFQPVRNVQDGLETYDESGAKEEFNATVSDLPPPSKKQIMITTSLLYLAGLGPRPIVEKPCRCGIRNTTGNSRILNGEPTRVNEFPWRVSINPVGNPSNSICAGTVITKDAILTSASCVHDKSIEHMLIDLGDHNLSDERETSNVLVSIDEKVVHEKYSPPNLENSQVSSSSSIIQDYDIAILRLAEPIEAENILPVCVPRKFTTQNFQGTEVITSGWGADMKAKTGVVTPKFFGMNNINNNNPQPSPGSSSSGATSGGKILQKVKLSFYTSDQVRTDILPNYFPGMTIPNSSNLVYTFDLNKGIHPIDLGTSMEHVDLEDGRYYAIGVAGSLKMTMALDNSQRVLGAWTDVTKFIDWIDLHVPESKLCTF